MVPYLIALSTLAVADIVAGIRDATITVQGIQKGVAVEGNDIIVKLFSNKPKSWQLDIYNTVVTALGVVLGVEFYHLHIWALAGGAVGLLLVDTGKHLLAVKNWRYLIAGGNPHPSQTAFQKFIGLLSWNEDGKRLV